MPTKTPANVPAPFDDPREGNPDVDVRYGWIVAQEGDWVYYQSRAHGGALYKMKVDGTQATFLSSDIPANINVVNGWIYYSATNDGYSLYRMRTNGTARARITSNHCCEVVVLGDWIYYTDGSNSENMICLWRVHTYGGGQTQLTKTQSSQPIISGDWIYFYGDVMNRYEKYSCMIKTHLDGTSLTPLSRFREGIYCHGWIYVYSGSLARRREDLSDNTLLHLGRTIFIAESEGWVYFQDYDDDLRIHRVREDGSGDMTMTDDRTWESILIGDWIYYDTDEGTGFLKRVRIDGTDHQNLP